MRLQVFICVCVMFVAAASAQDVNAALGKVKYPVPHFVRVQGGTFDMGRDDGTPAEGPQHQVALQPFWISQTEITREQFQAFADESRYVTLAEKNGGWVRDSTTGDLVRQKAASWRNPYYKTTPNDPVVLVTWQDAAEYAAWLTRKTGLKVALPTEAQWEHACSLDTGTPVTNGSVVQPQPASEAGSKVANMRGNVWEWTSDWFSDYTPSKQDNPQQTNDQGKGRVLRGGSWNFPAEMATCTFRQPGHGPNATVQDLGFRVVINP